MRLTFFGVGVTPQATPEIVPSVKMGNESCGVAETFPQGVYRKGRVGASP